MMIPCCRHIARGVKANFQLGTSPLKRLGTQKGTSKLKCTNFNGARTMKHLLTFQSFPMVAVIIMIIWAWISIFSVLIGSFF
jgi:hypothetical protein